MTERSFGVEKDSLSAVKTPKKNKTKNNQLKPKKLKRKTKQKMSRRGRDS